MTSQFCCLVIGSAMFEWIINMLVVIIGQWFWYHFSSFFVSFYIMTIILKRPKHFLSTLSNHYTYRNSRTVGQKWVPRGNRRGKQDLMLQVDLVHLSFLPNLKLRLSPFLGTQKSSENRFLSNHYTYRNSRTVGQKWVPWGNRRGKEDLLLQVDLVHSSFLPNL